eukprot:TRINITY_DN17571_c0_g1_i1.p1 TRINITY_DN17571_c0_g1~~TRINITY_DN17571_c0_g1_i1.p1  ORF type:complete len:372 (+),score=81.31 TRINITY_DN17571_c0_g1_i1:56-1171(+)
MKIGILKEIKPQESRVCMTPAGASVMISHGHTVYVETCAGCGSGFSDDEYKAVGAEILQTAKEVYDIAEMVMHVKEPQPEEYGMIRKGQIVFTYFHLAADRSLTEELLKTGSVGIAYETVEARDGSLPLLTPMSEVAGRLAAQEGAKYLEKTYGGKGVLLGGVTGTPRGKVVVLGGGVVGHNAAQVASGMGANVVILTRSYAKLKELALTLPANCTPISSNDATVAEHIKDADLVIGAVLTSGAKADKLITREMLKTMKPGTVIVDVAVDQGGCFETTRPTTHQNPVYVEEGIVHYCVANMPGAVPLTSTIALTNATLPYALKLADMGWEKACRQDPGFAKGVNYVDDKVTCKPVAAAFGMECASLSEILA